jgi:hypothetical protein
MFVTTPDPHTSPAPTRRSTLPTGESASGHRPGGDSLNARLVTVRSCVSGGALPGGAPLARPGRASEISRYGSGSSVDPTAAPSVSGLAAVAATAALAASDSHRATPPRCPVAYASSAGTYSSRNAT